MKQDYIPYQEIHFNGKIIKGNEMDSFEVEGNSENKQKFGKNYVGYLQISKICVRLGYLDAIYGKHNDGMISSLVEATEKKFSIAFKEEEKNLIAYHYTIGYRDGMMLLQMDQVDHQYCPEIMKSLLEQQPEELEQQLCHIFSTYPSFEMDQEVDQKKKDYHISKCSK